MRKEWRYYDKTTWTTQELRAKLIELDKELVDVQEALEERGK